LVIADAQEKADENLMEGEGQDEQVLKDIYALIADNEEAKLPARV